MKKMLSVIAVLIMVASLSTALALEKDEALALAQSLVGEAKLTEAELEKGVFEFEFRDASAEYDVKIRNDGEVLEVKTEFFGVKKSAASVYSVEAAQDKARALYPDADVLLALTERDDGFYSIKVFLRSADALIEAEFSADTGETMEITVFPMDSPAGIGADEVPDIIEKWMAGAQLTQLELAVDDGRRVYDGEATADGKRFEFELELETGNIVKWERD